MINIPTLIFFLLLYAGYRYVVKPYMIDAPATRRRTAQKEEDKGDFVDYEEVD